MTKDLHEFTVEHSTSFDEELAEALKDPAYRKMYLEAKHELESKLTDLRVSRSHKED